MGLGFLDDTVWKLLFEVIIFVDFFRFVYRLGTSDVSKDL